MWGQCIFGEKVALRIKLRRSETPALTGPTGPSQHFRRTIAGLSGCVGRRGRRPASADQLVKLLSSPNWSRCLHMIGSRFEITSHDLAACRRTRKIQTDGVELGLLRLGSIRVLFMLVIHWQPETVNRPCSNGIMSESDSDSASHAHGH
eukprot:3435889-Rhodomonas_salina.3